MTDRIHKNALGALLFLGLISCAKASFRGAAPSGSTSDAAGKSGQGSDKPPGIGGNDPVTNDVDASDIGMDGKYDPTDNQDPDNPNSPKNPYHPDFKPPGLPGGRANACTAGDQINFAWKGAEKECIVDNNRTFNFDKNKCLDLNVTKFPCDWNTLIPKLEAEGLTVTDKIKAARTNGSKLITCGEVRQQNRNRFIVQWIRVEDLKTVQGCEAGGGANPNVTTGCYTRWLDTTKPADPKSEDEIRAEVNKCLDEA